MMALEWSDIDLAKRQLCVQRSDWKGHVTVPKSGRLRYVPLTVDRRMHSGRRGISKDRECSARRTAVH